MISKHERLPSGDDAAALRSCNSNTGSLQPTMLLCTCLFAMLPCRPGNDGQEAKNVGFLMVQKYIIYAWHDSRRENWPHSSDSAWLCRSPYMRMLNELAECALMKKVRGSDTTDDEQVPSS